MTIETWIIVYQYVVGVVMFWLISDDSEPVETGVMAVFWPVAFPLMIVLWLIAEAWRTLMFRIKG